MTKNVTEISIIAQIQHKLSDQVNQTLAHFAWQSSHLKLLSMTKNIDRKSVV